MSSISSLQMMLDANEPKSVPHNPVPNDDFSNPLPGSTTPLPTPASPSGIGPGNDLFSADQKGDNFYDDYQNNSWYETDKGVRVLATSCGTTTTPSQNLMIRVCQPFTKKYVIGTAQRWNQQPSIPSGQSSNPNEILIKSWVGFADPLQTVNGCFWRASWRYEYHLIIPLDETSKYPTGSSPYSGRASVDNYYQYNFSRSLADTSFAPPTSGVPVQNPVPLNFGIVVPGPNIVPPA